MSRNPLLALLTLLASLLFTSNAHAIYDIQTGRFLQSDPFATGLPLLDDAGWFHGRAPLPSMLTVDVEQHFRDGMNTYAYLMSNPVNRSDPLGLYSEDEFWEDVFSANFGLPGPSDFITGALQSLVEEYSVNLDWDVHWATDWDSDDDAHSRLDNSWITLAIGRGLYGAFEMGVGDYTFNPLDWFASAGKSKDRFNRPPHFRSPKGVSGRFSNGWGYRVDTHNVRAAEGGFHIHVHGPDGKEVAKVNGRGGWESGHGGRPLSRPSEVPKSVRNEVNRLVRWAAFEIRNGR